MQLINRFNAKSGWSLIEVIFATILLFCSSAGSMYYHGGTYRPIFNWPFEWSAFLVVSAAISYISGFYLVNVKHFSLNGLWVNIAIAGLFVFFIILMVRYWPVIGPNSDSASALEKGARQLLSFGNPYSIKSHLGNTLTPLFGAFILAIPFVVFTGSVYLRGLVFIAIAIIFFYKVSGPRVALVFILFLVFSPLMRIAIPAQNDHFVIGIGLSITSYFAFKLANAPDKTFKTILLTSVISILFSCFIVDRFTYLVIVIPIGFALLRQKNKSIAVYFLVSSGVFSGLLLAIPFLNAELYIRGPLNSGAEKLNEGFIPNFGPILIIFTLILALSISIKIRTLKGALGVSAALVSFVIFSNALNAIPSVGFGQAFTSMVAVAYNGSWFMLGLFALLIPGKSKSHLVSAQVSS